MKDFFKFMFASMIGFLLTLIIIFFLFFAFIMTVVSFTQQEEVSVTDPSILELKLNYSIPDRSANDPFQFYMDYGSFKPQPGLTEILENIEKAGKDERVKGVYLNMTDVPSGIATITEIRNALSSFKTTGKFIFAYGNVYSQKAYYLASVADKVFLNPEGFIEFKGFRGNVLFMKGLLEKLEIEPQVIRHGKFKSAIEPLILDKMSDANKTQTLAFIQSMWDEALNQISENRELPIEELNRIADMLDGQNPELAYATGIVDSLIYTDEFLDIMAKESGVDYIKKENLISSADYDKAIVGKQQRRSSNKVAVIYASGDIVQGDSKDDVISGNEMARIIRNARLDESVKAVVLRVNSPGGDGLASDIILREVKLTQKVKPVVVSMGNVAASGGYYIACGADKIVASPTTITGSIGVFGVIPNFKGLLNNKLGVTFDGVSTNENSDFIDVTKPLSEFQTGVIQNLIERFYKTFVGHVAEGRKMTYEAVDKIGQGRVWSGKDALENGLVDQLGGLNDAVILAAELANLDDYRRVALPAQKEPFEQIMEDLFGGMQTKILKQELGENYRYFGFLDYIKNASGVQTRLPYDITIE